MEISASAPKERKLSGLQGRALDAITLASRLDGDLAPLDRVCRTYARLYRGFLSCDEDVHDVSNEILFAVITKITQHALAIDIASMLPTIARRKAIDFARQQQKHSLNVSLEAEFNWSTIPEYQITEDGFATVDDIEIAQRLLKKLRAKSERCYVALMAERDGNDAVLTALNRKYGNITTGNARTILSRARDLWEELVAEEEA